MRCPGSRAPLTRIHPPPGLAKAVSSPPCATMPSAVETDAQLASLHEELASLIATLNRLYHPVVPTDPDRRRSLEAQIVELRAAITARRAALRRPA